MTARICRPSLLKRVGQLYNLLDTRFVSYRSSQGHLDIPGLAEALGLAGETLYKSLRKDAVSVAIAHKLIVHSHEIGAERPLYWPDFFPFCLPEYETYSVPSAFDEPTEDDLLA